MDLRIKPILIPNKIDFQPKLIKSDGEGQRILKGESTEKTFQLLTAVPQNPEHPSLQKKHATA